MNYELAKELKEAGFSRENLGGFNFQEDLNYPTLSQLIEVCGERFKQLYHSEKDEWFATTWDVQGEIGSTPEEAVARLWLALNKK